MWCAVSDPVKVAAGLRAWQALVDASGESFPDQAVTRYCQQDPSGLFAAFSHVPAPYDLQPEDRAILEQGWDTLVARCTQPTLMTAFGLLSRAARADLAVRAIERSDLPAHDLKALRSLVEQQEVFLQACRRAAMDVIPRLLAEHKHANSLRSGFLDALRRGQEALAELLWEPMLERAGLTRFHVEVALRQPTPSWFNRMRPQLTLEHWERLLEELIVQPHWDRLLAPSFAQDPTVASALMDEAITEVTTRSHSWSGWADYLVGRGLREKGPLLAAFVDRVSGTVSMTEALGLALTQERMDMVPQLLAGVDFDQLRTSWITQSKPPKWEQWDRLGCCVGHDQAAAWHQRDSKKMPRTRARLRAELAQAQAPETERRASRPRARS